MKKIALATLIALLSANVWAEEPVKRSRKWTTIMTAIGAGGGFTLGMLLGLSAFDDSINSDSKVWTAAAVGTVGFGVAGFFVGRHMDHNRRASAQLPPAMTDQGIRWPEKENPFKVELESDRLRPSLLQEMAELSAKQ